MKKRPVTLINLNTAAGASAKALSYPVRMPVLTLDVGSTSLLLTTSAGDRVTAADLEFARQLAREAAVFALWVERCFHGRSKPGGVA
ncbi:hypothetical protein GT755_10705 [Herbidospora sp. NEAU-GS84]|uniref:Uncharacterized protein n=1 Tax=Herbidospora solisilvae TaxID=2696284 RepID=A0A7C9NGW4_9ACTN|nr:hypothetical protein [Herbidospora solisilvae]NAS22152.1 hypothetical protein [Herbidospora solisilvae]